MKFTVTMKTPDAVEYAINDELEYTAFAPEDWEQEFEDEDDYKGFLKEQTRAAAEKWFKYGETVSIEIDTEAGTATVLEAK